MFEPDGRPMGLALPGDGIGNTLDLAPGVHMIESFAHVHLIEGETSAVVFDTSVPDLGERVADRVADVSDGPISHVVLTHGHRDHAGGAAPLLDRLVARGQPRATLVAHEAVPARMDRYRLTDGYNRFINDRQFGNVPNWDLSEGWAWPFPEVDLVFRDHHVIEIDGLVVEVHHVRAETDDHLWAWLPERRVAVTGDLMLWHFPNAGNPAKAQRYPLEWAAALRDVAAVGPELLLPGHGLPIGGEDRVRRVLLDTADTLEALTRRTLELMNQGADLDTVIATVRFEADELARPYLAPTYDEPEFVVRNVWRLYGGWYDGTPSQLKPAPRAQVAGELAALAGGPGALAHRAETLSGEERHRLACHLIDLAAEADPEDRAIHAVRAEIYWRRRASEQSLMSAAIFESAARTSAEIAQVPLDE